MHRGNITTACSNWVRSTIDEATQGMLERCPGHSKVLPSRWSRPAASVGSTNGTSLGANPLWKAIYTMIAVVLHIH